MTVQHLSDGGRSSAGRWQFGEGPLNLGDLVDAAMGCTADSREAARVIEDLLASGRIRLTQRRTGLDERSRPRDGHDVDLEFRLRGSRDS